MGGVGQRNVLVEGVSGTGKSSVLRELRRRGYLAVDGDNELAYQGDPLTGEPTDTTAHENHVWDVARVRSLVDDRSVPVRFFCGGSRSHAQFLHLFDVVVVICVDRATLERRRGQRRDDEFGATSACRPVRRSTRQRRWSRWSTRSYPWPGGASGSPDGSVRPVVVHR